jgi:parallel beta-helix repeat protein
MRLRITIFLILFLAFANFAQTNISGTISSDSTLDVSGSPYIVTGSVSIASGVTLTVNPNVEVRFTGGTKLYVYGTLTANSATFTSSADTLGGTPQKGDWANIRVGDGSRTGTVTLNNCQVRYGGSSDYSTIFIHHGNVTITDCEISNSKWDGVKFSGYYASTLQLTNTTITNCNSLGLFVTRNSTANIINSSINGCDWPIRYDGPASVTFTGTNDLTSNTHDGIYINYNHSSSVVWDTIGVPYVINTFTIDSGDTLTIAPGNVIKSMGGALYVEGAIIAQGNGTDNIYFTSYKNDNLLGDTNADGSTSSPSSNDWYGVYFEDASDDAVSIMEYCDITFAGRNYNGGVTTENASPTIQHCTLSNNYYGAKFIGLSSPTFSDNEIGSSDMVPVALSFEANPVFSNNSFSNSDNQYDAIGILGGTLQGDATFVKRDFTSISNVTYLLLDNVTVPAGVTLTINPGIVIKSFYSGHRIRIEGKLLAEGTEAEPIVFTSVKDDGFGNPHDTNKDGTNTVPARGDWSGIVFKNGSDPASVMDYCIVKFAYLSWYEDYINQTYIHQGAITLINSSPTISNTTITDMSYGIYAFASSNPVIENCTFENSQYTPILMSANASPTFSGNTFTNSGFTALGICPEHLPASCTIPQRTVAGYTNITYMIMGDWYVNSGAEVTVDPGVVIKVYNDQDIYVEGGLKADASSGDPIIFTSMKDDNAGNPGDTNGDGDATAPAQSDWGTINFKSTSDDAFSKIDNCEIRFSGDNYKGAVTYTDAAAPMNNTTITDSYFGVRCEGSSTPQISNTNINNCYADPIAMSLKSDPTFSNISFLANGSKGIRILEGTLSSNATLRRRSIAGISNIAYIVEYLTISPNAVLTIEPGVVIKFNQVWCNNNLIAVDGGLIAEGTPSEKIIFTSIKDDSSGGDTNNDGNNSEPQKGDWRALRFDSSTLDSVNSLVNCEFRYGGNSCQLYAEDAAAIRIINAQADIDDCIIEQSASAGIGIYGSASPVISNSEINNVSYTPITLSMFSSPTFINNQSFNAGIMALGVKPENYSVNGTIPIRSFAGFTNITYYLFETSTINSGTEITVPAGIVFKNGRLDVKGKLLLEGTTLEPIVFTDLEDDEYGNPMDTNGDGTATSPSRNGTRVKFYDVSDDASTITNTIFRYSEVALQLDQASPTITNTQFVYDKWGIYLTGVSSPALTNSSFDDLTYAPIRTSLVSYPSTTSGNTLSGTTFKAIGILDGETLVQNVTLPKRNFAGITNIPYLFGNYTVASNAVLTIDPGVVLKFFQNATLSVKRGLQAIGGSTADSTIVFTYYKDDFYGGDTNSDSTDSSPGNEGWDGIRFEDESLDPLCNLDHVIIKYAGAYYWNERGAITTINASPTILHSTLKNNYNAIVAKGASNPEVHYCDIYQNTQMGIYNVDGSFVINAENNWWGSNSGPTHSSNPGGTGQEVSDNVDFTPWLGSGAANPIMGDVSLNGVVQAFDASKILLYLVDPLGADSLNELQRGVADVSANAGITAYDASLILQYSVGLISSFPAEVGDAPETIDPATKKYLALQKVNKVGLHINGASAKFGEDFTVPVSISNVSGVTAVQIEINFNPELYSLNDISLGENFSNYNMNYGLNKAGNKLVIAVAGSDIMNKDGNILNINLHVLDKLKGTHNEALTVSKFLANETDLTKDVTSDQISLVGKPDKFTLEQNYPNPFNPTTTIRYSIPDDNVSVRIVVYDIKGREITTLVNSKQSAGSYSVVWNATNKFGEKVSSGIYFYRIMTNKFSATKKMMLIK